RWRMRRSRLYRPLGFVSVVVALLFVSPPAAFAQSTATLQGAVTDSQNAFLPGVSITVRNVATGTERAAVTDSAGQYVSASMPGGSTSPQNAGLSAPLRGQGAFSFMTAGNRETSVNMMVNGINLNDLSNSQVTFQPSINTVSEFKVDNSTFSAEYGRNSGAIVNVATRSGANTMHGEAFDFYRDDRFDSRNYFNPASLDAAGNETTQSLFNRKQFGVK